MRDKIIVDIQIFQTSANKRGMGRYTNSLLLQLAKQVKDYSLEFVYNANLDSTAVYEFRDELSRLGVSYKNSFTPLKLQINNIHSGNYEQALNHNKEILTSYLTQHRPPGKVVWLIPSLMQEPLVSAYPDDPSVIKAIIWFDLMPYLMHRHYFPDPLSNPARSYLKRLNILPSVDVFFNISEASKNDLIESLSIPAERMSVINGSVNDELVSSKNNKEIDDIKTPFFIFPASPEPNKNTLNAIKGFGQFNAKQNNKYSLVITSDYNPQIADQASMYAENVVFKGHVSPYQLRSLYEKSIGIFFVSTYEGLGMPILEAVKFGKKVVCSSIPVFEEITNSDAFYWCDPYDTSSIAEALSDSQKNDHLSQEQIKAYKDINRKYSWVNSCKTILQKISTTKPRDIPDNKIAIVGPHPSSFSSVGKFVAETYTYLSERGTVHYYYDSGPSDIRLGLLRFNYLKESKDIFPISQLARNIKKYDKVIYHMGNSDHHMNTYLMAKAYPATMVLHDLNFSGKGLSGQMLSNGYLTADRIKVENNIETQFLKQEERFITSIVSSQKKTIVHSTFSEQVAKNYSMSNSKIYFKNHPVNVVRLPVKPITYNPIKISLAGILSDIKGLDMLEWLFSETDGLRGFELNIFGFGFFADKKRLSKLIAKYRNLRVVYDLTDWDFKQLLSSSDLLLNYRSIYNGEASRSTLEAMREGVVPIVRNVGWFSELPDRVCFKLDNIEKVVELFDSFSGNPEGARHTFRSMIKEGREYLIGGYSFNEYIDELLR